MSWVKISNDLYINTNSSYSIEKIDGIWNVIDSKEKRNFIPISDLYNNPVFPIDLSNQDVLVKSLESSTFLKGDSLEIVNNAKAKHFRGDQSNDPTTPSFSSQSDSNSGFYHISNGIFGYSSNGDKKTEFGEFGSLNGTQGTDLRNIIQVKREVSTMGTATTSSTVHVGTGLGFSYTPIKIGSTLRIHVILARTQQVYTSGSGAQGFGALYKNETGILGVGASVSSSSVVEEEVFASSGDGKNQNSVFNFFFYFVTTSLNQLFFSYTHRTGLASVPIGITSGSRFQIICEEYL